MRMAVEEVTRLVNHHPEVHIQNHEVLIASFLQSATQIYLHELQHHNKATDDSDE